MLAFFFSLLLTFSLILSPRDANAQLDKHLEGSPTAYQQLLQNTGAARTSAGYDYSADISIQRTVGRIINYVTGLIGTLLLVLIVFGAYEWMTAAGNDDQITKAKDTIRRAIIGAFILLAAYAITRLVVTTVIYSTQKSIMSSEESSKELRGEWNEINPFDGK